MTKLLEGMTKRFGALESVPLLARETLLNPRIKKNGFITDAYNQVVKDVTARFPTK